MRSSSFNFSPGRSAAWIRLLDALLVAAAASVATDVVHHGAMRAALVAIVAFALWALGARALHHYDTTREQGVSADLLLTSILVLSVAVSLFLLRGLASELVTSWRGVVSLNTFVLVLWPGALMLRLVIPGLRALQSGDPEQVLILGTAPLGRLTGVELRSDAVPREVIGFLAFGDERHESRLPAPLLGKVDELERVLRETPVDEVYIAGNARLHGDVMQAAVRTCERFGVPFAIPATQFRFERARPSSPALADGYVHYLSFDPKPVQMAIKRLLDIVVSATALLFLSPLLLATALAVKLTSRGPILYRQPRVGQYGRPFHMLKFRSMVQNAEALQAQLAAQNEMDGPVFKIKHDPRITPIGRFMRKFSVDELPQLLNVLRGEMTLVGPRPPVPKEVAQYEAWQRRRLSVRPGLTCHWQVSGRNDIKFEQWMLLDMQYIDHWSLKGDLALLAKTVPVVLSGRGAS